MKRLQKLLIVVPCIAVLAIPDVLRRNPRHLARVGMTIGGFVVGLLVAAIAWVGIPQQTASRTYWPTVLDTLAVGHAKHTHAEVRGQVVYVRTQEDGDVHIKLVTPLGSGRFVIAECIPRLPCARPRVGSDIIVRGITRWDPEHHWGELHPVESWTYATAGE